MTRLISTLAALVATAALSAAPIVVHGPVVHPAPAGASIAEVGAGSQRATSNTTGAQDSKTLATPGNVTSGNMIVVAGAIWTSGGTTVAPAVTDTRSTSYTVSLASDAPTGMSWRTFIAYGVLGSSGSCTVTVNPNGASSDFSFSLDEFSGVAQADVDGGHTNAEAGTGTVSDTITTVAADTLIIGVMSDESALAITPGATYTQIGEAETGTNNQPHSALFKIVNAAGAQTVSWSTTGTQDWTQAKTMSFKP